MKIILTSRRKAVLAAAGGVLTAGLMLVYLKHQRRTLENRFVMTRVCAARRYITAGKNVGPDNIVEMDIPALYLAPSAVRVVQELRDSKGEFQWKSRIGILKGEQITRSKLFRTEDALGLAWTLVPGQNAVCLRFTPEQAVGGLVEPGDRVNVLCAGGGATEMREILRRVLVLAVDGRVWDPANPLAAKTPAKTNTGDSVLVTLCLTASEAAVAATHGEKGKIYLALTSPME